MATARKHTATHTRTVTEEVVTYTLELSEREHRTLCSLIASKGDARHVALLEALEQSADAPDPAPLAVGDRVRVLRDYFEGANVRVGDVLTVTDIDDVDIHTNTPRGSVGGRWYLSLNAEGAGWERC